MSVTNNPGKIPEVHQAWIVLDESVARYGCVFGLVDNDPTQDIQTSQIASYFQSNDQTWIDIITRRGSTYRVVYPDAAFMCDLQQYLDSKK